MRSPAFKRHALAALFAAALLAACGCRKTPPAEFGESALNRAGRLCALGPRDQGSLGSALAAAWIKSELETIGLVPKIDEFSEPTEAGTIKYRNVLAQIPGTGAKRVLLLSHYDTKPGISPGFVGANDGASSTGLLLELAAWFRRHTPSATISFAFLDGEECRVEYGYRDGLAGSMRLAGLMRSAGERADAVILLDMVGDKDLSLTIPANTTRRLADVLKASAKACGLRRRISFTETEMLDDHVPFMTAGYPAIDLIDFQYGSAPGENDYWHTDADTMDKLSPESLRDVGALVIEMIRRL